MAFKESEHPRDAEGKFVKGAGGSKDPDSDEIAKEIFPHLTDGNHSGIIDLAEPVEMSIYVNSADPLSINASKIKPIPGYEDMVIHGDQYFVQLQDLNGDPIGDYTAQEFAEWLQDDPNYHGGSVRLVSCSTGAEDDGFAQSLADCLGVSIMAPTHSVWVAFDGTLTVGRTATSNDGRWRVFEPKKGIAL